jgi:protein-L-isoaspartate(D-aspartate) O-methyltransferase
MSDPYATARQTMLEEHLAARGIDDPQVLDAMRRVPRELFVDPADTPVAYDDCALGIDCGQTISQPYIVALMSQALEVTSGLRVLELGTGSGYQAAVLATMGAEVFSVERHPELARQANARIHQLKLTGVHIRAGDGRAGWPQEAPFDRVIITAASDELPPAIWEQLAEGGLVVAPLGGPSEQTLQQIRKIAGRQQSTPLTGCRFVPLV